MRGIDFAPIVPDYIAGSSVNPSSEFSSSDCIVKNDIEILDAIYENGENFLARASQELKRAQRYLSFVSYLTVECQNSISFGDRKLCENLRKYIRGNIRQTDIISGFHNGKLCLLLIETGYDGAEIVGRRLEETIKMFMQESPGVSPKWRIKISGGSFPDGQASPNDVLIRLRNHIS